MLEGAILVDKLWQEEDTSLERHDVELVLGLVERAPRCFGQVSAGQS